VQDSLVDYYGYIPNEGRRGALKARQCWNQVKSVPSPGETWDGCLYDDWKPFMCKEFQATLDRGKGGKGHNVREVSRLPSQSVVEQCGMGGPASDGRSNPSNPRLRRS
jgi:hypothetical protein